MLEVEMDEHLGYEKNSVTENNSENCRNGYEKRPPSVITASAKSPFHATETANSSQKSLKNDRQEPMKSNKKSCKCMSQRDIEDTLKQIYGIEISRGLVSRITYKILSEVNKWQNRPLEAIYPVVFFDGIVFNSRKNSEIVTKCVYFVFGINMEDQKEILGT